MAVDLTFGEGGWAIRRICQTQNVPGSAVQPGIANVWRQRTFAGHNLFLVLLDVGEPGSSSIRQLFCEHSHIYSCCPGS